MFSVNSGIGCSLMVIQPAENNFFQGVNKSVVEKQTITEPECGKF